MRLASKLIGASRLTRAIVCIAAAAVALLVVGIRRDGNISVSAYSPAVINTSGRVQAMQPGDTLALPAGSPLVSNGDISLFGSNALFQGLAYVNAPHGIWISNLTAGQTTQIKTLDVVPNGTADTTAGQLLAVAVGADNRTAKSAGGNTLTNYGVYGNALNGDANYSGFFDNGTFVVNGEAIMNSISLQGNETQHFAISSTNVDTARTAGFVQILGQVAGTNDTTVGGQQNIGVSGAATATRSAGGNPLNNIGVYGVAAGAQNNYSCFCDTPGILQVQGNSVFAQEIFALGATAMQLGGTLNANSQPVSNASSLGLSTGVNWTSGTGVPSGACTTGSLYTNVSGGAATTLYVCTATNTWTAK
jgi:hypothetical protein